MDQATTDNDETGTPVLRKVSSRIAALERRAEFLEDQIEDGVAVQMTEMYRRQLGKQTVDEAMRTLQRRVNQLGVAEHLRQGPGE